MGKDDNVQETLKGYIDCCVRIQKTKLTPAEKKGLTEGQIRQKEAELAKVKEQKEKQGERYRMQYSAYCDSLETGNVDQLRNFVETLVQILKQTPEWIEAATQVLTSDFWCKKAQACRNNITDLYGILKIVNDNFKVSDYPALTLDPEAHLYGSIIRKPNNNMTVRKAPSNNELILALLDLIVNDGNYKRAKDWLTAILEFNPDKLQETNAVEYAPSRRELAEKIYTKIDKDGRYRNVMMNYLLKDRGLRRYMDCCLEAERGKKQIDDLNEQVIAAQEEGKKIEEDLTHRLQQQSQQYAELVNSKEALEGYRDKYEKCRDDLDVCISKLKTQCDMNKRIVIGNEQMLQKSEQEYNKIQNQLADTAEELDALKQRETDMQADLQMKERELQRLKDEGDKSSNGARLDILRKLAQGIGQDLSYLYLFDDELLKKGALQKEEIPSFDMTIRRITETLAGLRLTQIGEMDRIVPYDSSIHDAMGQRIANGDPVRVVGFGWKIDDSVYIKIPVEKEGK